MTRKGRNGGFLSGKHIVTMTDLGGAYAQHGRSSKVTSQEPHQLSTLLPKGTKLQRMQNTKGSGAQSAECRPEMSAIAHRQQAASTALGSPVVWNDGPNAIPLLPPLPLKASQQASTVVACIKCTSNANATAPYQDVQLSFA